MAKQLAPHPNLDRTVNFNSKWEHTTSTSTKSYSFYKPNNSNQQKLNAAALNNNNSTQG